MNQTAAEAIILALNALGAGTLIFVAGVIQPIMNEMSEERFNGFLTALVRTTMGDPISVTIATLPIIAAVVYFIAFGFEHWWFTAGFAIWLVGSTLTKIINMPIYQWVADPANRDPETLRTKRQRLEAGNRLRAWLTLASVALMAAQFSAVAVLIVIVVGAVISVPLIRLARMYAPA